MKKITTLLFLSLTLYGCVGTKFCTEWYSRVRLFSVTKDSTNHEQIYDYYKTDFPKENLILLTQFHYGDDSDYEGCKTSTMINSIINDSITITSSSKTIIGNDTIQSNKNLFKYFNLYEKEKYGHYVFEYDKNVYQFPKFANKTNTFKINIKTTDRILTDSCIIRFE
jgi:hypothetical protein